MKRLVLLLTICALTVSACDSDDRMLQNWWSVAVVSDHPIKFCLAAKNFFDLEQKDCSSDLSDQNHYYKNFEPYHQKRISNYFENIEKYCIFGLEESKINPLFVDKIYSINAVDKDCGNTECVSECLKVKIFLVYDFNDSLFHASYKISGDYTYKVPYFWPRDAIIRAKDHVKMGALFWRSVDLSGIDKKDLNITDQAGVLSVMRGSEPVSEEIYRLLSNSLSRIYPFDVQDSFGVEGALFFEGNNDLGWVECYISRYQALSDRFNLVKSCLKIILQNKYR